LFNEGQQQPQGVAIAGQGVGTDLLLGLQSLAEEVLH
jgi:hypothetical protein